MKNFTKIAYILVILLIVHSSYTQNCFAGQYRKNSNCVACPPGTFRGTAGGVGITACSPCRVGTYAPDSGSSQCTTCNTTDYCAAGAATIFPKSFQIQEAEPVVVFPKPSVNGESVKLGVTIIVFLLTIVPLVSTAFGCLDEELCGLFDMFYSEKHHLNEGGVRTKIRSGLGGVMSLFAISLFIVFFTILVFDFMFDNVVTTESLSINSGAALMSSNNYRASVYFHGGKTTCNVANSAVQVTGFDGTFAQKFTADNNSQCHFEFTCTSCTLKGSSQSILVQLTSEEAFSPRIAYKFETQYLYSASQYYTLNGSINPNSTSLLFYGTEKPSEVNIRLFRADRHSLVGGPVGAPWVQLFNALVGATRTHAQGVISEFVSFVRGAEESSLTLPVKGTAGVAFKFNLSLSPNIYVVKETLKQTLIQFIGICVAIFVLCYAVSYLILISIEYCTGFWEKVKLYISKRKKKAADEEKQMKKVEKMVHDVKIGDIELNDVDIDIEKQKEKSNQNIISDEELAKKMYVELSEQVTYLTEQVTKLKRAQDVLLSNNQPKEDKKEDKKEEPKEKEGSLLDLN